MPLLCPLRTLLFSTTVGHSETWLGSDSREKFRCRVPAVHRGGTPSCFAREAARGAEETPKRVGQQQHQETWPQLGVMFFFFTLLLKHSPLTGLFQVISPNGLGELLSVSSLQTRWHFPFHPRWLTNPLAHCKHSLKCLQTRHMQALQVTWLQCGLGDLQLHQRSAVQSSPQVGHRPRPRAASAWPWCWTPPSRGGQGSRRACRKPP